MSLPAEAGRQGADMNRRVGVLRREIGMNRCGGAVLHQGAGMSAHAGAARREGESRLFPSGMPLQRRDHAGIRGALHQNAPSVTVSLEEIRPQEGLLHQGSRSRPK